jgi:hypothetical protein
MQQQLTNQQLQKMTPRRRRWRTFFKGIDKAALALMTAMN